MEPKSATSIPRKKRVLSQATRQANLKRSKAWMATNEKRRRKWEKEYYQENAERLRAKQNIYRQANPEKVGATNARRRARKAGVAINDLTAAQWREIQAAYDYRCVFCVPTCKACKTKTHRLTKEHLTPLSKKGPNTASNVVPACLSCNAKKQDGPVLSPVQPLLLTLASARKAAK